MHTTSQAGSARVQAALRLTASGSGAEDAQQMSSPAIVWEISASEALLSKRHGACGQFVQNLMLYHNLVIMHVGADGSRIEYQYCDCRA